MLGGGWMVVPPLKAQLTDLFGPLGMQVDNIRSMTYRIVQQMFVCVKIL